MLDAYQLERRFEPLDDVHGVALVLHGGTDKPAAARKPVRRLWPTPWGNAYSIQEGIAKRTQGKGIAVWALRHRLAGWDDDVNPTPVAEAREALREVQLTHPGLPVVLVGHSMGGRTAIRCADHASVVGVVGRNPYSVSVGRRRTTSTSADPGSAFWARAASSSSALVSLCAPRRSETRNECSAPTTRMTRPPT